MTKLKVLQVIAGAAHGGAEAFFTRLVIALHKKGLSQHVIMRPDPFRRTLLSDQGIFLTETGFKSIFDISSYCIFRREIKRFKPDIVMTWMSRATQMCPRGDFVHTARLGGYYDLKYYKKCDHLIGNTADIVAYFHDHGWPKAYAHYLPNFVDSWSAPPLERERFNTPLQAPLLIALGRFHQDKAFDVLIKALVSVPEAYLWLAGEGPEFNVLKNLAFSYHVIDRIRFIPWQQNTAAFYKAGDIFICPSRIEPLGNVIIEAWAQRLPVIAAESSGPRSLIIPQKNGLLVPVESVEALSNAINSLIENVSLRNKLAQEGWKTYQRNFTEEIVTERYLTFFEKVKNNKRL